MNYTLKELLDIPRLRVLLDALEEIQKIPSAIIDKEGNVLTASAWQDICTKFHRTHPEIENKCRKSDQSIESRLDQWEPFVRYRCPMGLVDAAMPIILNGEHLGNAFVGQIFTELVDEEYFIKQARQYDFDESQYLEAMRKVPLIPEDKLRHDLFFIHDLTQMLAEQGLQQKRQQEAEENLREAEWKFKALFENGPIGVAYHRMIYDADGNAVDYYFLDANNKYLELTGVNPRGKTVIQAFPGIEKDPFDWIGTFGRVARDGETIRFEQYLQVNDRWYDCVSYQYQPDHFVAAFQEITERKKAEEQLETERFRLAEIIRGTNVGTWEWNVQTGQTNFNERWAAIIGYNHDELVPVSMKTWQGLIHPDDLPPCHDLLEKHFHGEIDYYECEFRMKHLQGHWVWVFERGKVSTWTDNGQPLWMYGTLTNIDERKRLEEERKTAEKLNSVGTLAGGIAHDFNNILAGLYGNISLAKNKLAPDHPGYRFLDAADRSMNRATQLTNQLLTFAKGGAPVKDTLSLKLLVAEVVQFNLAGSNIKANIVEDQGLWLADVDHGQIQQVFGNLTINANQAMPDGGQLTITLENVDLADNAVAGLNGGRYIRITMADEGVGIAPEDLDRIFEPYFSTKASGSGLGLATAYSVINNHGGHISVDSQPGQGTKFTLHLPASRTQKLPQQQPESTVTFQDHSARILLLDDNQDIRATVTEMLDELGCSVTTSIDGVQTIDLYRQALSAGEPYDLVILDLTIPGGMGGKTTAQQLITVDPDVKMVVSSGYADDPVMSDHTHYGFQDIIPKPYNLSKLSAVLERTLTGQISLRVVSIQAVSRCAHLPPPTLCWPTEPLAEKPEMARMPGSTSKKENMVWSA